MCLLCYCDTEKATTERQIKVEMLVFLFVVNKRKVNWKHVFIYVYLNIMNLEFIFITATEHSIFMFCE